MKKNRIALYIELKKIKNKIIDADFEIGNPGIGGTQYLFLITAKYLNEKYGENYSVILTDDEIKLNDKSITIKKVDSKEDAISFCEKEKIDNLVFNANSIEQISTNVLNKTKINIMLWAHNTMNYKKQKLAAKIDSIYKVICVSKTQYDNMHDTVCFDKCTYIENVITDTFYSNSNITDYSEKKVIYIGSLMPQKGVDELLKIWKYVEKKEPEAKLYIFGGGNIWNPNVKTTSTGADQYYDKIIQKILKRLKKSENIIFMGAKGWKEINTMILTARVGIVNPSHYYRDETFCLSAIEMEAHGLPIVSRLRNDGLLDTIKNNETGFLEKSNKKIANKIIYLLSDATKAQKHGMLARKYVKKFIIKNEIYKWNELINNKSKKKCKKIFKPSKDDLLLKHDFIKKIIFTIKTGKYKDILKRKIRRG